MYGSDGSGLECSKNQLAYPDSSYMNLRVGMSGDVCISVIFGSSAVVGESTLVSSADSTSVLSSYTVESQEVVSTLDTSSESQMISSKITVLIDLGAVLVESAFPTLDVVTQVASPQKYLQLAQSIGLVVCWLMLAVCISH